MRWAGLLLLLWVTTPSARFLAGTVETSLGIAGALAYRVLPDVTLGAEARYVRSYDGPSLARWAGAALFVGPNAYAKLPDVLWVSAGWSAQVTGQAAGRPGALDLSHYERHRALLRVGYSF